MVWKGQRARHSTAARKGWAKKGRRPGRTVVYVDDGDSFKLKRSLMGADRVRLLGVNTPERGKPGYGQAKHFLSRQIKNKRVTIEPKARDKYGRLVAEVFVRGASVNKKLKKKGW